MPRFVCRFARAEEGAAAVEFAMVLPVFLIFMMGILSFTQAFWIRNSMQFAVDEAGRYAMVNSSADNTAVRNWAIAKLYGVNAGAITVNVTTSSSGGINYKTIAATYTFAPFNGIITLPNISLSTQNRVPVIP